MKHPKKFWIKFFDLSPSQIQFLNQAWLNYIFNVYKRPKQKFIAPLHVSVLALIIPPALTHLPSPKVAIAPFKPLPGGLFSKTAAKR